MLAHGRSSEDRASAILCSCPAAGKDELRLAKPGATTIDAPRFPRVIEDEPELAGLGEAWRERAQPLWSGGDEGAPRVELTADLKQALTSARLAKRLVRGLESADQVLAGQARGLAQVDRRTGVERGGRVSRLLIVADDGSDRFYRSVATLLARHAPRVLALRLATDEATLGSACFGAGQVARALLLDHKDAVSQALVAAAFQWGVAEGEDE